ncbi:MAG: TolC family protein [Alphaproteobacteria bacterium]|nr:TolC family protein [Alphaproteobacteria bacterium]
MFHKVICGCFGALVVVGCSVGPDYQSPAALQEEELQKELPAASDASVVTDWYKQFDDAELNRLIAIALQNSTSVAVAASRLRQARAELRINAVQYLPQIDGRGGYNYEKNSKKIGPTADTHYYSAGFDADWEIDLWGAGRRQTESDEAAVKAAEYTLKDAKVVLVAEVVLQYIRLLESKENLRLAQENLRLQQQILQNVKDKYDNGLSDELAYQQALYLTENTRGTIPALQNQVEQYRNSLSVLLGVLPSALPPMEQINSPIFKRRYAFLTDKLYKLPAAVVRQRPDVAAAEQRLIGQNAQIGKAVAALYPSVDISALWGYAAQGGRSLFGSKSQTFSYNPLVNLPLLDWNRLQNNVKLQKDIREEYFQQYKETVLNAVRELRDAVDGYRQGLRQQQNDEKALTAARQAAEAAKVQYENGLTEFSQVLTTQQNQISAQNRYVADKASVFSSVVAYYKAAGGGYL